MLATRVIFKNLPRVYDHPYSKNSPKPGHPMFNTICFFWLASKRSHLQKGRRFTETSFRGSL
jgi:hypothetical protein